MLRRTVSRRIIPDSVETQFPHGVRRGPGPMFVYPKHPNEAPTAGGNWVGRHGFGVKWHLPYEFPFYRTVFSAAAAFIIYDNIYGLPVPFMRDNIPGSPSHSFRGNNWGVPHHFWCYQDGWTMPNTSGVKRWSE